LYSLKGQAWPARDAFQRALAEKPGAFFLYDLILPMDFALADKRAAEQHADTLLKVLPNHAFGNYIKGALLLERKDYKAAEGYFRRSLDSAVTLQALNDFAVLLLETRRPEEAERAARAALEISDKEAAVWDTLASALTALERHDEAYEALEKATAAGGVGDPRILLHWAQALHRRGDTARAKEAAEKAHANRTQLDPLERDALLKLRDALQRGK
jgi:predicted Zn-dependent protease